MRSADLRIDVTEAAGLGEPAHVAVTVTAPDVVPDAPLVCFAKPGAGYSRAYYSADLPGPGPGPGSQAASSDAEGAMRETASCMVAATRRLRWTARERAERLAGRRVFGM